MIEELEVERERESDLVVAIDGKSGAGKGTLGKALAEHLGVEHYSAGDFFRQIAEEKGLTVQQLSEKAEKETDLEVDRRTLKKGLSESCVIDSRIACRVLGEHADLKIRLKADLEERARRIASRDNREFEKALKTVEKRDSDNRRRYRDYYGVDTTDLSIYDVVIDNTELSIEETNSLAEKAVEAYLGDRKV